MGMLLLADIVDPSSFANRAPKLANPLYVMSGTGFHGGLWRCGFKMDSIGVSAATIYYLSSNLPAIVAVLGAAGAAYFGIKQSGIRAPHHWAFLP